MGEVAVAAVVGAAFEIVRRAGGGAGELGMTATDRLVADALGMTLDYTQPFHTVIDTPGATDAM